MTENNQLTLLLTRAKNLRYNDTPDLDDIIQKTKLQLTLNFSDKAEYPKELAEISFTPTYSFGDGDDSIYRSAWQNGKQKLINFIDTRIQEFNIISSNTSKKQETNKTMHTKTTEPSIKDLPTATIVSVVSIILILLGGAFTLGKFFGENRFDEKKIELIDQKNKLIQVVDSLKTSNQILNNKITDLQTPKIKTQ